MKAEKEDEIEGLRKRVEMINSIIAKKQLTADSCKKSLIRGLQVFGEQKVDEFTLNLRPSTATNTDELEAFLKVVLKYKSTTMDLSDILSDESEDEEIKAEQSDIMKKIIEELSITEEKFWKLAEAVMSEIVKEKVTTTYAPDKTKIKKLIQDEKKEIAGAYLQTNYSLTVK